MNFLLNTITKLQNLTLATKITLVVTGVIVAGSTTTVVIAIISNSQTQTETLPTVSDNTSEAALEGNTSPKQGSNDVKEKTTDDDATQHDENSQDKDTNNNAGSIANSSSGTKPTPSTVGSTSNSNSCTIQEYGVALGVYSRPGCYDYLKCNGLYVSANGENTPNYFLCEKDYPDYQCNRYGKTSTTCIGSKMIGVTTSNKPINMSQFISYQSNKLQGTYRAPNFASFNMPTNNVFQLSSDAEKRATSLITSHDNLVVEMCASEQNGVWTVTWGAYERKLTSTENGVNNYVVTSKFGKDHVKSAEKSAIDSLAMQYQNEIQQWQTLYTNKFLSWYH